MKLKCFDCGYEFYVRSDNLDYDQQAQCPNCHEFIVSKNNQTNDKYKGGYDVITYCRGL
jgi:DNA-directed RNA polymerase subunit RPC12/RpoP